MTEPTNIKKPARVFDLVQHGHMTMGEVRKIAQNFFDGKTTGAGPEGYIITAVALNDLPENLRQWIDKAILQFPVENVLDANMSVEAEVAAEAGFYEEAQEE